MSDSSPFTHHRYAALALLNDCPNLLHKEAGFCGHVAVAVDLTGKQTSWLAILLKRHGLPQLVQGDAE
jgi:hypothetical protein